MFLIDRQIQVYVLHKSVAHPSTDTMTSHWRKSFLLHIPLVNIVWYCQFRSLGEKTLYIKRNVILKDNDISFAFLEFYLWSLQTDESTRRGAQNVHVELFVENHHLRCQSRNKVLWLNQYQRIFCSEERNILPLPKTRDGNLCYQYFLWNKVSHSVVS